jgi:hypothetical protein
LRASPISPGGHIFPLGGGIFTPKVKLEEIKENIPRARIEKSIN